MQPQNSTNTISSPERVTNSGEWLYTLPEELIGVLPQTVWSTLGLEQKKDVLRQNNLLEKYESTNTSADQNPPVEVADVAIPEVIVEPVNKTPEVVDAKSDGLRSETMIFKESVDKVKEIEKQNELPVLNQDEKKQVEIETASQTNPQKPLKLFGYTIPTKVVSNAKQVSDDNNITDGSTWAATLIKKIFAIFD